jgi:hypothetical protein
MKKETLEEVAENYINTFYPDYAFRDLLKPVFIDGAKWKAERMYSEEDLKHLEFIYGRLVDVHNENPNYDYILKFKSIIEQFKKK